MAKQYCQNVKSPREGKTVYIGSDWKNVTSKQFNKEFTLLAGYEITERTIDKYGQFNFIPDVEVETWWTNLVPLKSRFRKGVQGSSPSPLAYRPCRCSRHNWCYKALHRLSQNRRLAS